MGLEFYFLKIRKFMKEILKIMKNLILELKLM